MTYEMAANIAAVMVPTVGGLVAIYKIRCDRSVAVKVENNRDDHEKSVVCSMHTTLERIIIDGLQEVRGSLDSLRKEIIEIYRRKG
jgi:hypothetical protein